MGSSLSPVISNIFMEHSEQLALVSAPHKPAMWLRYVEDTFFVWPHGTEKLNVVILLKYRRWTMSRKTLLQIITHHRQNPLGFIYV
jgi:hypothetical protein